MSISLLPWSVVLNVSAVYLRCAGVGRLTRSLAQFRSDTSLPCMKHMYEPGQTTDLAMLSFFAYRLPQITHTPMILAEEFSRSQIARTADFSTSRYERGVYWMRERNRKRRRLEDEDGDSVARDQAYFSDLAARPLPCANQIDATYGRLPATVQSPGEDYVLTRGILLAQFASPNGKALADAVELISTPVADTEGESLRLVDGIDLNCVGIRLPQLQCKACRTFFD